MHEVNTNCRLCDLDDPGAVMSKNCSFMGRKNWNK